MPSAGTAVIASFSCALLLDQQPAPPPVFDAVAIKPSVEPPGSASGIFESTGRIVARNVTLKRCVRGAFNVPEPQIVGGPKWADQDRYTIEAKATSPAGDRDLMLMLQALLADRFKLMLHREQRTIPGYRLVLAKGGLKAQPSVPGQDSIGRSQRGRIEAQGYTMAQLALKLAELFQQPVLDATGLTGKFDLKLEWTPDSANAPEPGTGPSIFTALQEQLGLKLESGRVSAEILVIDSAEKPSEN